MKAKSLIAIITGLVVAALLGYLVVPANEIPPIDLENPPAPVKRTMQAFASDHELKIYFKEIAERQKRELQLNFRKAPLAEPGETVTQPPATDMAKKEGYALLGSGGGESVTNVQHAGVDEGGIVKVHRDHLVILRRGRLFTVAIDDDTLKPISAVDAFGPDINPRGTWYDEMLVSEDTIAVIGYSYERGGTEVGLFKIDETGNLSYQSTYHLRSNDYYSSRNYASRLIGNKLIFYTPSYLSVGTENPFEGFPAIRKWHKRVRDNDFARIVPATRVYKPECPINSALGLALHTVTVCDLSNGGFSCEGTAAVGPAGRVFYVSPQSVYVWMSEWIREDEKMRSQSIVYRLPLDGSAPSAVRVSGSPIDQFSFLESEDEHLNVLVQSEGAGEAMWSSETARGDFALLRLPLASFSDGSETVPTESYRQLPRPQGYTFQNRFVGDYLIYGSGSGWGEPKTESNVGLYIVPWAASGTHELRLAHGVDRIEAMGEDAVVVGTDGTDLHFTAVQLRDSPKVADKFTRKGASQGELRSHGFFYKLDGDDSGTIGLPISVPLRPGYHHLFEDSAAILFLRNNSLHFEKLGELAAKSDKAVDDRCRASCVDWYGNSRPLFLRGRIFALLGYEIVEGTLDDGRMRERRRMNYAPRLNRYDG